MSYKPYQTIVEHYQSCFQAYGDTFRGMDWPKPEDVEIRFEVMLGLIPDQVQKPVSVLDVGCGTAHLYEYMQRQGVQDISYNGLDISQAVIERSREKYPTVPFYCVDVLEEPEFQSTYDYLILNGMFTEKVGMSYEAMLSYWQQMMIRLFPLCTRGMAFNVMSKQVDWERDDLFHLPLDTMADFVCRNLSRHFVIRNDYGLYEYTVYLYHQPEYLDKGRR